jgi:hypothetical protein
MSRKARDMGHPRRSFAYGNVKIENGSIAWEMILLGGGLEERWAGDLLVVRSGGFAVPESVFWSLWHD